MGMARTSQVALLAAGLALGALASVALAQGQPAPANPGQPAPANKPAAQNDRRPFDIKADDGIEWDKDRQVYIARGNVQIVRGDRMLRAPIATAFYRITEGGKNEIFKMEAEGGVKIGIGDDTAAGEKGVYNLDGKMFVLTGRNLVYNGQDARVTARDSLEYYEERKVAIARGNAHAVREHEWLKGDVMTAFFEERREKRVAKPGTAAAPAAQNAAATDDGMVTRDKLVRIEAVGNVVVNSCDGIGRADKLIYFPETGEARLEGNVRLTRGEMQMRGERAEMNTRTQFMRLLPGPDGKQVGGTFFMASESFKPDNIPFEAGGVDPCSKKQASGEQGAKPANGKPAAAKPADGAKR